MNAGAPGTQPQQPPGAQQYYAQDRRKARHWTVGITVAAILAAGGVIAGVALAGGSGAATSAGTQSSQAAALNATLSSADSPVTPSSAPASAATANSSTTASPSTTAGTASTAARCTKAAAAARAAGRPRLAHALATHCRGIRLRVIRLLGGIDGQLTIQTKNGTRSLAYERGIIQTVTSGSNIVVRGSNGTTWTWDLVSNTVVREKGAKTAETALAPGQAVWVGGPVNSGTKDARLIVIRPAASSSSATPSATPSSSAS